ncbi:hypothetical protein D3C85_1101140 [compost metagenome]
MTYKTIQELYKNQFNKTIKTCWIADVKRELGLTTRISKNRINKDSVKYPCPNEEIKIWLREILN